MNTVWGDDMSSRFCITESQFPKTAKQIAKEEVIKHVYLGNI